MQRLEFRCLSNMQEHLAEEQYGNIFLWAGLGNGESPLDYFAWAELVWPRSSLPASDRSSPSNLRGRGNVHNWNVLMYWQQSINKYLYPLHWTDLYLRPTSIAFCARSRCCQNHVSRVSRVSGCFQAFIPLFSWPSLIAFLKCYTIL